MFFVVCRWCRGCWNSSDLLSRRTFHSFILLETIYGEFDVIAGQLGVFKVETVGDCYVACAGLPDPRDDHAVVMVKFARDCRSKMTLLTKELETSLGPDTADLQLRFGLHSGPVTAGVLRGQKSRKFSHLEYWQSKLVLDGVGRVHA